VSIYLLSLAGKLKGLSTFDKSTAVQNFYLDLEIRFEQKDNRTEIFQQTETDLLTLLLPDIYCPNDTEDAVDDKIFYDKMVSLEKLPLEDFEKVVTSKSYSKAIQSIQKQYLC
jgi:hypothetical protein